MVVHHATTPRNNTIAIADMRRLPERDYSPQLAYGAPPMGYAGDTYYPAYAPYGYDVGYGFDNKRARDFRRPDFHHRSPPHVPAPKGNLIKR